MPVVFALLMICLGLFSRSDALADEAEVTRRYRVLFKKPRPDLPAGVDEPYFDGHRRPEVIPVQSVVRFCLLS